MKKKIVTFIRDVITMTSLKRRHNQMFLQFGFVLISLKNHNLTKSCNSRHQNRRLKGVGVLTFEFVNLK